MRLAALCASAVLLVSGAQGVLATAIPSSRSPKPVHDTLRQRAAARAAVRLAPMPEVTLAPAEPAPSGERRSLRLTLTRQRAEVVRLVNSRRGEAGLEPVRRHAVLEQVAQIHAEDMKARSYFAHESPDGLTPEDRLRAAGYLTPPCACNYHSAYGENIATGFVSPADVMKSWMSSPGHRANILNPDFREIGIGISGRLWSQEFGVMEVK